MNSKKSRIVDRLDVLSYASLFQLWTANILTFAALYVGCSLVPGSSPTDFDRMDIGSRVLNAIYYSVITATNTGYGDIVPHGFSKFFAALEAFSGLFLFALFMSKLVSQRQDIAITQMHKISFEGTFHDIREDLHIVRGDFDKLIRSVTEHRQLSDAQWAQFMIACQQIQNLICEVPNFYDTETNLYRIDVRRERLLAEAFHRTLERLIVVVRMLHEYEISLVQQAEALDQVRQVVVEVRATVREWQVSAGRGTDSLFRSLDAQADEIHAQLELARRS